MAKIIIGAPAGGGIRYMFNGLAQAFASAGHEVYLWIHNTQPILDMFERLKPVDIFITYGYASALTPAVQKAIKRYKPKTLLYVPAHPDSPSNIVKKANPELQFDMATPDDIKAIDSVAQYIDGVFIHHHADVANVYLDGWQKHVKNYYGVGMACDIVTYDKGQDIPTLKADCSFIGSVWQYKLKKMAPWIYPLCNNPDINVKLFGSGWGVIQGLGPIPEELASSVWRNTTVNLGCNEPQAGFVYNGIELPEVNERPFKVIGTGNFYVGDRVTALVENYFLEDEIVTASTAEEYHEKVIHFIRNPDERLPYIERGQKRIFNEHSYHDRAGDILSILRFHDDTHRLDVIKQEIIQNKFASAL